MSGTQTSRARLARSSPIAFGTRRGLMLLALLLTACDSLNLRPVPPEPAPPPKPTTMPDDALWRGTIGAETVLANASPQALRGFGLVIGLDGTGGGECPTVIRDYLIDFMAKQLGPQPPGKKALTPGELIDSRDNAVVEITGVVPVGARKGARFDLEIRALPGTSTTSLEGGLLMPAQLRYFEPAASGQGLIEGRVLAEAGGPIFVNPFREGSESPAEADPRRGFISGGGRAIDERPTRLMLLQPNYRLAQAIERRVNERFGHKPKAAEAMSAGYVDLHTTPVLAHNSRRYQQLVAQILLDSRPAVIEERLHDLVTRAATPSADLERIALTWEAAGRVALPHIQALYTRPDPLPCFYAARTGLRLGDLTALPALGEILGAGPRALRLLAVRELGEAESPQAAQYLVPLLSVQDQEIRLASYEALLQRGHPAIRSVSFRHVLDRDQLNFVLDVVESDGPPLLYVRRTRVARLAVFGPRTPVNAPVFYAGTDDPVTVHTVDGSDEVRVFAKRRGRMSDQIVLPPRLVDLITALADVPERNEIGRLRGVGLPYSRVLRILAALVKSDAIPARMLLEQTTLTELLGPDITPDRPEAEPDRAPPSEGSPP